ncbi:3'-tyrosyl-DNA phosphodiesterase [Ranunculus cassubicifolius]
MHSLEQRRQHFIHSTNFLQGRTTSSRTTTISPNIDLWLQTFYSLGINLCKFLKHASVNHHVVS